MAIQLAGYGGYARSTELEGSTGELPTSLGVYLSLWGIPPGESHLVLLGGFFQEETMCKMGERTFQKQQENPAPTMADTGQCF